MAPNEKRCLKCDVVKPLEQFHVQAAGKYGRTSRCRECTNAEQRAYKERNISPNTREFRARKQSLFSRGLKECIGCREVKSHSEFYRNAKGNVASQCKECDFAKHRAWKARNPDHMLAYVREYKARPATYARDRARRIASAEASPRQIMQITLRHGLKRRPTENPATIDDLMGKFAAQKGRCALTGIPMTWRKGTVLPTSISLDRIDPTGGYSADNLRLICHAVNAFRGRMSDAQMFEMARRLIGHAAALSSEPTWDSFPAFTGESEFMRLQ